ncbi:MAG: hypothetical protein QM638_01055 [Nocardioides sp.]|uniref:hypothetical protein n=1 Tax=Nocardioides sp. TaxID=35761 RepID=UPI0039E4842D
MKRGELPRICVSRAEAAAMLGVSVDTIRAAKESGRLRAKAVSTRKDGQVTKELYAVAELREWFEQLEDA